MSGSTHSYLEVGCEPFLETIFVIICFLKQSMWSVFCALSHVLCVSHFLMCSCVLLVLCRVLETWPLPSRIRGNQLVTNPAILACNRSDRCCSPAAMTRANRVTHTRPLGALPPRHLELSGLMQGTLPEHFRCQHRLCRLHPYPS